MELQLDPKVVPVLFIFPIFYLHLCELFLPFLFLFLLAFFDTLIILYRVPPFVSDHGKDSAIFVGGN